MINELFERELRNTFLNDVSLADYINENYVPKKSGKWIASPHIYGVAFCSECGYELKINNTKYCPNCGAKMSEIPTSSESNRACHTCKHYTGGKE